MPRLVDVTLPDVVVVPFSGVSATLNIEPGRKFKVLNTFCRVQTDATVQTRNATVTVLWEGARILAICVGSDIAAGADVDVQFSAFAIATINLPTFQVTGGLGTPFPENARVVIALEGAAAGDTVSDGLALVEYE